MSMFLLCIRNKLPNIVLFDIFNGMADGDLFSMKNRCEEKEREIMMGNGGEDRKVSAYTFK